MANKRSNKWKEYYNFLSDSDKIEVRKKVMQMLDISQASFYRQLDAPHHYSPSDKLTIARLVNVPPHFLFPEVENINA